MDIIIGLLALVGSCVAIGIGLGLAAKVCIYIINFGDKQ